MTRDKLIALHYRSDEHVVNINEDCILTNERIEK